MGRARISFPRLRLVGYLTLTCLIFLLVQNRCAMAQVDEGAITGTVQDTTGAVVPNAIVTLVNTDQGITLETKSDASGGGEGLSPPTGPSQGDFARPAGCARTPKQTDTPGSDGADHPIAATVVWGARS